MSKPPSILVFFVISDKHLVPEDVTKLFGIKPTDTGYVGQKVFEKTGRQIYKKKDRIWEWSYEKRVNLYSTDEAVRLLLKTFWPKREIIRKFLEETKYEAGFTASVTIYEDRPVYELEKDTIEKLAYLHADFGIDIFDYSDTWLEARLRYFSEKISSIFRKKTK